MEARLCVHCNSSFNPSKYSPRQTVCSDAGCQKKRQLESMRVWRQKNPNYFKYDESKGQEWIDTQRRRSREWRQNNPDKVRSYRSAHLEEYRRYMREYMRAYREKKKSSPSPDGAGPIPNSPA